MLRMFARFLDFFRGGGAWSLVLCFAFSAAAEAIRPRPFVLIDEQELATLRRELASDGWKSEIYRGQRGNGIMNSASGIRSNADEWLKRKTVIPGKGGHFHHFFCDDGSQLELPKEQRFVAGPYRCPKCGKMYEGEKYEAAMRRMVHGWLAQATLDLGLVGALEQKSDYANKAAEILLRYAEIYPGPHTGTTEGGMIYQSLDEAMWVIPLAQAYDLICDRLADVERKKIEHFLRAVADGIQKCGTAGNWGSWHLSAVGVVGYAIGDTNLIGWATDKFKAQIRDQLGDDGLWPESVHTYHFFPLVAFLHFAEAARHAGVDLYDWEAKPGKSLMRMFSAPLAYAYPDLRLPAINDGWYGAFLPPDCYELAYYRTKDPRYGWVIANGYQPAVLPAGLNNLDSRGGRREGLYAFLFGKEIPSHVTPPTAASVNFPVLGICILRSTNGAMMTFDYGPFLGHGQRDKMGITLFANGGLWMADYGTPGYGAAILEWYQSTFSHNTIVVDGKNQQPTRENYAQLWLNNPLVEAAESETREAYPGVTHRRTVVRIGDYFVVRDKLFSETAHVYDFYLHSEGKLSLDRAEKANAAASPKAWIEGLTGYDRSRTISGRWSRGEYGIAFWVMGSSETLPLSGMCPAETGARKIPLLIARQEGKTVEFVAVLFPCGRNSEVSVRDESGTLSIRHGDTLDILTWPSSGKGPSLTSEPIASRERNRHDH